MHRLLIAAAFVLAGPGLGQVDPTIKSECMKAVDFQGCVKTLSGETTKTQSSSSSVDINRINSTGNTCPADYAYVGSGYCQRVICVTDAPEGGFFGARHDSRLGGKEWSCKGNFLAIYLAFERNMPPVRAPSTSSCPDKEP